MATMRRVHKWLVGPKSDLAFVTFRVLMAGYSLGRFHFNLAVLHGYIALLLWLDHLNKQAKVDAFHKGIVVGQQSVMTARGHWPTVAEAAKKARP